VLKLSAQNVVLEEERLNLVRIKRMMRRKGKVRDKLRKCDEILGMLVVLIE
jgi:hypothetical protein